MAVASAKRIEVGGEACYRLASVMDISAAQSFYDDVRAMLDGATKLCIDASAVSRLTTPCAQILLSLHKFALSNDIELSFANPTEHFFTAFKQLGLEQSKLYQDLILG